MCAFKSKTDETSRNNQLKESHKHKFKKPGQLSLCGSLLDVDLLSCPHLWCTGQCSVILDIKFDQRS